MRSFFLKKETRADRLDIRIRCHIDELIRDKGKVREREREREREIS